MIVANILVAQIVAQRYPEAALLAVAHQAIERAVAGKTYAPAGNTPTHPVFVTIERKGVVLGCRGSLQMTRPTLESAVASAAKSAAVADPKYKPLSPSLTSQILVTVTVVEALDVIDNVNGLGPESGLVLRSGDRVGIVLPWEGKDPSVRLKWAFSKAGVMRGTAVRLERMTAQRFRG